MALWGRPMNEFLWNALRDDIHQLRVTGPIRFYAECRGCKFYTRSTERIVLSPGIRMEWLYLRAQINNFENGTVCRILYLKEFYSIVLGAYIPSDEIHIFHAAVNDERTVLG